MTRDELKGKIQTVLGPIAPEALGRTLMHEHVLSDIRPPGTRSDNDLGPEITLGERLADELRPRAEARRPQVHARPRGRRHPRGGDDEASRAATPSSN